MTKQSFYYYKLFSSMFRTKNFYKSLDKSGLKDILNVNLRIGLVRNSHGVGDFQFESTRAIFLLNIIRIIETPCRYYQVMLYDVFEHVR